MKYTYLIVLLITSIFFLGNACERTGSTDDAQNKQTEQMVRQAQQMLGMPEITNFTERRLFKNILERRDQIFPTYTYIMDMNGNLHFLCNSIGYGIPFSTQYTNPMRTVHEPNGGDHAIPQPDPNGLFMPTSSDATYVLCGTDNDNEPQYVEEKIIVTTFELDKGEW